MDNSQLLSEAECDVKNYANRGDKSPREQHNSSHHTKSEFNRSSVGTRATVSAGFTNVSSLAVAAFDLAHFSLSILQFVFVLDISK